MEVQGPNPEFVQNLFSSISNTYDQANDLITFGMARRWRKSLVRWSEAQSGDSVLDCASGTGDLAFDFKKVVGESGTVIGTDFCEPMLKFGREKSQKLKMPVDFQWADAMNLPFENHQFNITSISYGIRNVENPIQAISEMARVTRPGGRVMILETGQNRSRFLQYGINFYCNHLVPKLGGWVSGNSDAYEYLNKSSAKFPAREEFLQIMKSTDQFSECSYKSILGGASFIYKGIVKHPA
ncbi:MAG: bifunctional demethylmenaquinone methyltransferase/2-methoxy-6-polyprenyl-1,4-benzoquinol methylase UbiE [Bdellovibrionales bacterium]|nr:bifunctional demethylmenaquinone methyltransferase/2-methoxy-6-polyprenyl-1,4-benzoquinol methylase UbiE [Bdellovibrionales bacterium]